MVQRIVKLCKVKKIWVYYLDDIICIKNYFVFGVGEIMCGSEDSIRFLLTKNPACSFSYQVRGMSSELTTYTEIHKGLSRGANYE